MKQRILFLAVALAAIFSTNGFAQTGKTYINPADIKFGTANQILVTNSAGTSTIWSSTGTLGILTAGTVAGGDLSGTFPNPTVAKINTTAVSPTVPTTGQILAYNGTAWTPTAAAVAQTLSLATNTLSLSGGGGSVSLAPYLDNTDAQTLTFTAATNTLAITGGNSVVLGYGTYAATEQFYNPTGSTITLATTGLPTDLAKIHVFRPFRLWHGTGNDWTISGQVITFTSAFAANERVVIDIFK